MLEMSGANTATLLPRTSDKRTITILRELHAAEEGFVGMTGGDGQATSCFAKRGQTSRTSSDKRRNSSPAVRPRILRRSTNACAVSGISPRKPWCAVRTQSATGRVHDTSNNLRAQPTAEQNALYTIELAI